MAEYGAHLATHLAQKPSIFEVLAQENLARALRNALRHLISYFADLRSGKRPRRSWLKEHRDELVTLADLSVQFYHLARYASSFSEHFYGLRRVASGTSDGAALKRSHILRSLAALVLLPYVRTKLEALVLDDELPGRGWIGTLRRLYPAFSLACEAASLSYALFYAIGKSPVHSPALSLSSVRLEVAPSVPASPDPNAGRAVRIVRGVADAFSATLATAAFLLHFVDCEISDRAAVLTTSGYVFCYDCIRNHLSSGRTTCPVTGYPSSHESVVLLVGQ
ncbi:hypothetical protein MRX96_033873 [Rhipicephalus microplus]